MTKSFLTGLLFALSISALGAGICGAQDKAAVPTTPLEQLKTVEANSSLDGIGMQPWHLRTTFDLFDIKGSPKESGTIEEWWLSPTQRRIVISSPSYKSTLLATPGQASLYNRQTYLINLLLQQIVHPLQGYGDFDGLDVDRSKHKFGKVELDCFSVTKSALPGAKSNPTNNKPSVSEFCIEPSAAALRIHLDSGGFNATRNSLATFRGKSLAVDNVISYEGRLAIKGHVETLEAYRPDQTPMETSGQGSVPPVAGIVLAGRIVKHAQPIYPPEAKFSHISGSVVLCALIAEDGTIQDLDVVSSPDDNLSKSSLQAVRQWTYSPYLLNGRPTNVETTITINFNINRL